LAGWAHQSKNRESFSNRKRIMVGLLATTSQLAVNGHSYQIILTDILTA
jgi:hypothetical protein